MPAITPRRGRDIDDLAAAGRMLTRAWQAGSVRVAATPGDLEWWYSGQWPSDLGAHLRLWELDGRAVGWSWNDEDEVEWHVGPATVAIERAALEAIVGWAAGEADAANRRVRMWAAADDLEGSSILEAHGFRRSAARLSQFQRRPDEAELAEMPVPDGYSVRAVRGPQEIEARVAVHRAAFAPSKRTTEMYRRLVDLPHYTYENDLVVEAPDGSFAAFAMAWWDPVARVGEFEPVGTHPDHQRRGLGRAVLTHGLHRFRDLGAAMVQVYAEADNPASEGLYQAVGFRRRAYHDRWERPAQEPRLQSEP